MNLASLRGVILEELVLYLLGMVGYRIVAAGEEGSRLGHSGLEIKGRGEWHQIDALAAFDKAPAFMYPLRLMVEAKCYKRGKPVQIETVRNSIGVLKDISENFFTFDAEAGEQSSVQVARYNYYSAVFSTSGYTIGAQKFALAHQIFLIQYRRMQLFEPIVEALLNLSERHFQEHALASSTGNLMNRLRAEMRALLGTQPADSVATDSPLSPIGRRFIVEQIVEPLVGIRGSYFGMLQGKWPMHLLSLQPLPPEPFAGSDEVACRVYGRASDRWSFSPVNSSAGEVGWFRLEFDIPEEIVAYVNEVRNNPVALALVKQEHFSFLDLTGKIGGVMRQIRLRLDEEWLSAYLDRVSTRKS